MMKKTRRTYDKEFKLEVVKRSLEEVSVKSLAEELVILEGLMSRWLNQFPDSGEQLIFPGRGNKVLSEEQEQINRLNKALKENRKLLQC